MLSHTFRQDPAVKDKAVLYLRYSSESQTENSIEGQRRECMEFAKKNNLDVLGEYVDTNRRPEPTTTSPTSRG